MQSKEASCPQKNHKKSAYLLIPCYSGITTTLWVLLEIDMTEAEFDKAFDQGEYEAEYSQWLADHFDCNSTKLEYLAENFESYEDFRESMVQA
jgi:hypothetical protein